MGVTFTIPGEPQGKGRPRVATRKKKGGGTFIAQITPTKTVAYEGLIAHAAQQAMAGAIRRAMPDTDAAEARRMVWAWWKHDHPAQHPTP